MLFSVERCRIFRRSLVNARRRLANTIEIYGPGLLEPPPPKLYRRRSDMGSVRDFSETIDAAQSRPGGPLDPEKTARK